MEEAVDILTVNESTRFDDRVVLATLLTPRVGQQSGEYALSKDTKSTGNTECFFKCCYRRKSFH